VRRLWASLNKLLRKGVEVQISCSDSFSEISAHRAINEDFVLVAQDRGLFVLCDGVGGDGNGHIAARSAASDISEYVAQNWQRNSVSTSSVLIQALKSANSKLRAKTASTGIRCTTTAIACLIDGENLVISHVGDSRAYHLGDRLTRLTTDHTIAEELLSKGVPAPSVPKYSTSHLTQSIGVRKEVNPSVLILPVHSGDRFFICSDGVYSYLHQDVISRISLGAETSVEFIARIKIELKAVDPKDNYSGIAFDLKVKHQC
jgi:PPM family protein phosphatase